MTGEKSERVYRFEPHGPYELPAEEKSASNIDQSRLPEFWKKIETEHKGLSKAIGCYIFAIRQGSSLLPWYVGKTEKKDFEFEAVAFHKLQIYHRGLSKTGGGVPLLFLIPRLTDAGNFRKSWKSGSISVGNLEDLLIGTALSQNPDLLNVRSTKHIRLTVVPGYMNEKGTKRTASAESLAELLATAPIKP